MIVRHEYFLNFTCPTDFLNKKGRLSDQVLVADTVPLFLIIIIIIIIIIMIIIIIIIIIMLRLVNSNRLVNLGISKQQHLYLRTKNLI